MMRMQSAANKSRIRHVQRARVNDSLVAILNSDCAASALRAITQSSHLPLFLSPLYIYMRV